MNERKILSKINLLEGKKQQKTAVTDWNSFIKLIGIVP